MLKFWSSNKRYQ